MDKTDRLIIDVLQQDGRASVEKVAEQIGLTPTPTRRRIRQLESSGAIKAYAAIAEPEKCGLAMTIYVSVRLEHRSRKHIDAFERAIKNLPEVVRCDLVSGSFDYLMLLHLPSMSAYNRYLHTVIANVPGIAQIESSVVIGNIKSTHRLGLSGS